MTCGKGGLHCPCGIHASDERVTSTEEKHNVVAFSTYQFTMIVRRFHCTKCGYTSVTADVENPYDPVKIPGDDS